LYYLLLNYDKVVGINNRNRYVLDLKNMMLRHQNKMDMVHLMEKNDLQTNFDILLDRMMIVEAFSCYYYWLDMLNSPRQMLRKMDRRWLMMVMALRVNSENHRDYSKMMQVVAELLLRLNEMEVTMNRMT
jgi:hypothetical protein